jgi:hypothetical protein
MANIKETHLGHWECTGCKGRDVYVSEEVSGAMAVTMNTPGPVDPTFINTIKNKVTRCKDCGERARWILSPEGVKAKGRRENSQTVWIGYFFGVVFAATALYFLLTWPYAIGPVILLLVGAMALLSLIFFGVGRRSSKLKKAYLKQDPEK